MQWAAGPITGPTHSRHRADALRSCGRLARQRVVPTPRIPKMKPGATARRLRAHRPHRSWSTPCAPRGSSRSQWCRVPPIACQLQLKRGDSGRAYVAIVRGNAEDDDIETNHLMGGMVPTDSAAWDGKCRRRPAVETRQLPVATAKEPLSCLLPLPSDDTKPERSGRCGLTDVEGQ